MFHSSQLSRGDQPLLERKKRAVLCYDVQDVSDDRPKTDPSLIPLQPQLHQNYLNPGNLENQTASSHATGAAEDTSKTWSLQSREKATGRQLTLAGKRYELTWCCIGWVMTV